MVTTLKYIVFSILIIATPIVYWLVKGLSFTDLGRGWKSALVIIILSCGLSVLTGKVNGKKNFIYDGKLSRKEKSFIKDFFNSMFFNYFIWGTVQQGLVFLIYLGTKALIPEYAVIITASIFGFLHFPNYLLMFSTFGMAQVFMFHFELHQNILFPYIAHGMMATCLYFYIPNPIITDWVSWKSYWEKQRKLKKEKK